ncbi:MAG: hypothetical protein ACYDA6_07035 [Solirubrobacteraceae bacterium]
MSTLPFWLSIAVLSLAQGVVVALARVPRALRGLARFRGRWWGLVPALSVAGFVALVSTVAGSAGTLTYLALVSVPPLAAVALAALTPGARPAWGWLVPVLFAIAWADAGGLAGEGAAVSLTALSCVTLGVAIAVVTPRPALAAGMVAMALVDSALVISDLLQRPNNALNAARPAAGLPSLQAAAFGSAVMGYGDLFIAGALGGMLALHAGGRVQRRGALLVGVCALGFDLLVVVVKELPATVPVAAALVATLAIDRGRHRGIAGARGRAGGRARRRAGGQAGGRA